MAKFTSFIISLTMVSLVIGGLAIYYSNLNENYAVTYDESQLEVYNKFSEIYNQTDAIKEEATQIDPEANALQQVISVIDGFFNGAYKTLILAWKSFDIFNNLSNDAVEDLGAGEYTDLLKKTIGIMVTILLVLGIIVSAIVKREM